MAADEFAPQADDQRSQMFDLARLCIGRLGAALLDSTVLAKQQRVFELQTASKTVVPSTRGKRDTFPASHMAQHFSA